jgi:hypothetical protein
MIHIPIEQRYDKRNQMFHSSAFAIAAGVVGVAGAAASAGMSMYSAGRAAKAQGAAAKAAARKEKKALKGLQKGQAQIEADLGQIQMPVMDIGADIKDAERITGYNIAQLEQIYPGAKNQRQLASLAITDMLQGKLPQSVIGETMREAAQRGGAGFNIATAGKGAIAQAPQYDYARAIGATSLGLMQEGLNQSARWQQVAGQFIQSPLEVSQQRLAYGMGAANVGLQKVGIKADLLSSMYGAQTGQAQRGYAMQQENIKTSLARDQALAQGIGDVSSALSSGVGGVGSAYGKLATAKAAAGGFNYGQTAFGAGGGSVGGMGTYGPNYGMPSAKV